MRGRGGRERSERGKGRREREREDQRRTNSIQFTQIKPRKRHDNGQGHILLPLSQQSRTNFWPQKKFFHLLHTCVPYIEDMEIPKCDATIIQIDSQAAYQVYIRENFSERLKHVNVALQWV